MRAKILLTVIFILCSAFAFSYDEVKHLSLSAAGIELLEIDCGAGYLEVSGIEGLKKIEVRAEIILKGLSEREAQRFIKNNVKLSLEKRGNRAVLISEIREPSSFLKWGEKKINLTVKIPKNIDLDVDDGSGSIEIEDIKGNLDIDDGSGSMCVEDITGNLDINDGSGSIDINNITGNLEIDDGSGTIRVESINGNIEIDDGSGEIEAADIAGEVLINDGSGSIDVRNSDGDVEIIDGSGSIYINGVEKDVIVKRDGSGSIKVVNVKGNVRIPRSKKKEW